MEKINIAELLKDCPKVMELDCTMFDDVKFNFIKEDTDFPIKCFIENENSPVSFNKYGEFNIHNKAKCVIFPKGKTTWEGFVPPCKFKDGDIIYTKTTGNDKWLSIYQGLEGRNIRTYVDIPFDKDMSFYCNLLSGNILCYKEDVTEQRLATEEEKQKLFESIKANGYKWNAETKTWEKLVEPKFKVGDKIKNKNSGICDKVIKIFEDCYLVESCLDGQATIDFDIQDNWELVPNKFDITTLKPFDKVLTRANNEDTWVCNIYSHALGKYYVVLNAELNNQCIPFNDGTKHLVGTTDDCDEFYKTWEE